jgi:anti-sigma factor ChrR (cupin superfamily)
MLRGMLASYALGILTADERAAVRGHLDHGCRECEEELGGFERATVEIGFGIDPVQPPAALGARIRAAAGAGRAASGSIQVWKAWDAPAPTGGLSLVRAGEGTWETLPLPGVQVKRLSFDPARRLATMLVRMAPGASYPSHRHAGPEECYVVEGELHVGDLVMRAGDFQRAEASSAHVPQFTETGCLLLITSSTEDELL